MGSMDANAKLYAQQLYYRADGYPYQSLSLPWWVRTPEATYPPRHMCKVEPLICGERVFRQIATDLKQAKSSVDIITWGFDPGMVLDRGVSAELGQRYGELLKEIATRKDHPVQVRLLVWHDDPLAQHQVKNIPGYYGTRFPNIGCAVTGFYSASHQSYNAEWFEQVCANAIPNISFHVRSVPLHLLPQSLKNESSPSTLPATLGKMYATHHQKMLLIDYESPETAIGYVMGHNSITDFWDTERHLFRDPRRERFYHKDPTREHDLAWKQGPAIDPAGGLYVPGMSPPQTELDKKQRAVQVYLDENSFVTKPYQDVSCRLQGAVLHDLNHNFCQAWKESTPPSSFFKECYWLMPKPAVPLILQAARKLKKLLHQGEEDPEFIERRKTVPSKAFNLKGGPHSLQLLRTQPLHGEKTIKECYANLTRQMHHYIFIQNQYIQYEPWAEHLKECVRRLREAGYRKEFYVFILTSTPESAGMDLPTYGIAGRIGQSATMVTEHDEAIDKALKGKGEKPLTPEALAKQGIHVVMGSLWTCAIEPPGTRLPEKAYEEIYIHAKVAIVDDVAFTIGSANLNLRSMAMDSELNVLSQAHDVAYQLRCDLFRQCTGEAGPEQFGDMAATLRKWQDIMLQNAVRKSSKQPITSQLIPFHVNRKPGSPVV